MGAVGWAGDRSGVAPGLGPLADHATVFTFMGMPWTFEMHALLPGSPAINAGAPGVLIDQRAFPIVGINDIGAFEFHSTDADGDGFDPVSAGGTDCDDTDASIFPGAPDIAGDGIDQDCDGADSTDGMPPDGKEPPPEKNGGAPGEAKEPPVEEEVPPAEEPAPDDPERGGAGDEALIELEDGGQFVFWQLVPVLAADVFGTAKIAWLWNPFARVWTSFIPVLGMVNFQVEPGVFPVGGVGGAADDRRRVAAPIFTS